MNNNMLQSAPQIKCRNFAAVWVLKINNQLKGQIMKTMLGLVVGLFVSSQVSFAAENASIVPFDLGPQHFKNGDSIVIEQAVAASPLLAVGDKVTVRGRYVLASEDKTQLCLYLATSDAVGAEPIVPTQKTEITRGSGSFELSEVVKHPGHLHLSFYQVPSGTRLGSVYFGTAQQMKEISNLKISN
ncbi:MAG: hypothetical protein ACREDS_11040 [Limisphaerales bacterium]